MSADVRSAGEADIPAIKAMMREFVEEILMTWPVELVDTPGRS